MGTTLMDEIIAILGCKPEDITKFLISPSNRMMISLNLRWKMVQTVYKNKNGAKHKFQLADITAEGAQDILTFGRLARPWNVTICGFFYARHGIRIRYPQAPCAVEHVGVSGKRYYPIELLEICEDLKETGARISVLTNSFKNVGINEHKRLYKIAPTMVFGQEDGHINMASSSTRLLPLPGWEQETEEKNMEVDTKNEEEKMETDSMKLM